MSVIDVSSNSRRVERFLFDGVPESAEQNWERDFFSHVLVRTSGRARLAKIRSMSNHKKKSTAATIIYDHDKQEVRVEFNRRDKKPKADKVKA